MPVKKVSIGKASKPSSRPRRASSAKIQNALYRIADAASAFSNMQDFYASLHGIVGELMVAENFIVQVYDEKKRTVTYPYVVDISGILKPVFDPIPVEKIRKGLAMYVLQTGKQENLL